MFHNVSKDKVAKMIDYVNIHAQCVEKKFTAISLILFKRCVYNENVYEQAVKGKMISFGLGIIIYYIVGFMGILCEIR